MTTEVATILLDPREFFQEQVNRAITNQKLRIREGVAAYLVNLLCDFIYPHQIETPNGTLSALDTPLAFILKEASEAPPGQKLRILRYLGDSSLYFAGFFQDFFNRRPYDVGYYASLGSTAYGHVANLIKSQHGDAHFAMIYRDLAEKFEPLVEVLAEIADTPHEGKPKDVLMIYDKWNRHQSERLRRILNSMGIQPISVTKQTH